MNDQIRDQMSKHVIEFQQWSVSIPHFLSLSFEATFANYTIEFFLFTSRYDKLVHAIIKTNTDTHSGSHQYKNRPNVHAMFHLLRTAQDYGTLVNVCCSTGETKHKPIKAHARKTNNQCIDKQLLRQINTIQSVRFVVNGAYKDTHASITAQLRLIQQTTPRIFGAIAPIGK